MSTSVETMFSNKSSMEAPPPHITIVEADTKALNFLCEQLGDLGDLSCLKSLHNLEDAVDSDLFIISIGLDRPENLALCQQLRESDEFRDTPIICYNTADNLALEVQAMDKVASDVIKKTSNPLRLRSRIESRLRQVNEKIHSEKTDALTGLYTESYLRQSLNNSFQKTQPSSHNLMISMIEVNNFDQIEATFSQNLSNVLLQVLSDTMSRSFTRAGEMIAHNGPARFITVSYDLDKQRSINYHRQLQSNFNQVIAGLTQQENTSASSMALVALPVADIKDYKVNADSVIDRVGDLLLQAKQSSDHFLVDQLEPNELTTH